MFHMYLNHDHNGLEVNNSKFTVNRDYTNQEWTNYVLFHIKNVNHYAFKKNQRKDEISLNNFNLINWHPSVARPLLNRQLAD